MEQIDATALSAENTDQRHLNETLVVVAQDVYFKSVEVCLAEQNATGRVPG